jgi:hypothetical protein
MKKEKRKKVPTKMKEEKWYKEKRKKVTTKMKEEKWYKEKFYSTHKREEDITIACPQKNKKMMKKKL